MRYQLFLQLERTHFHPQTMSTAVTNSDPSCYLNHHRIVCCKSHFLIFSSHSLSIIKHPCHPLPNLESHPFKVTCKFTARFKVISMAKGPSDNFQSEAPVPAKPPSPAWKKWMVGLMLSIILPSFRHKWGPFLVLKSKLDTAIETVESVTEVVEELAEEVEKLAEGVENKLPEDTKLKETMQSVEKLAKEAVKEADLAQELIHKVQDAEKEAEKALIMEPETERQPRNKS
uniref:Uncharacterized protein n=1 Tax=Davidia involucrata TaxID=16924 RepID=A0A5B7BDU0_DAVIN